MVATMRDAVPLSVIPVKTHKSENTSKENLMSGNNITEGMSDSMKSDTTTIQRVLLTMVLLQLEKPHLWAMGC